MTDFTADSDQKAHLLRQMDVTMVQKLAFASAHFQLHDGARILDLGCGSGHSSYNFALLNPNLNVVAIDYDAEYIRQAKEKYQLPNLTFIQADALNLDFPNDSFDGVFNSSFQHEIYSYKGYDIRMPQQALKEQLRVLKPYGVDLIRDFARASEPGRMVWMDLPTQAPEGQMSKPDMLRRYAKIADALKPEDERGFLLESVGILADGWERFYLPMDRVYEFIWRKEYTVRFEPEAQEKYSFWTPSQYREIPQDMGARVIYTSPYYNPWIRRNWIDGKVRLYNEDMREITPPPSNYIAVIQKIPDGAGQLFREQRIADTQPAYLRRESFVDTKTDKTYDLVSRPGDVYDILPYRVRPDGRCVVYAKSAYPRPIVNAHPRQMSVSLDGKSWSGHMVEPLAVANQSGSLSQSVREVLVDRAGLEAASIGEPETALNYYTAPADIDERVTSAFVPVDCAFYDRALSAHFSGFSSDGTIRAYDIQELLRGVQVGMLAEARLEMNVYALAMRLGIRPESWIGDRFAVEIDRAVKARTLASLEPANPDRGRFVKSDKPNGYFRTVRALFTEETGKNGRRKAIASHELEFMVPDARKTIKGASHLVTADAISVMPVIRDAQGQVLIGLRATALPALTRRENSVTMTAIPHVRLHSGQHSVDEVREDVAQYFGIKRGQVQPLGEGYFPSMGIMPGRTFPMLVTGPAETFRDYCSFVPLAEALGHIGQFKDANTILAIFRCAHALDLWPQAQPAPVQNAAPDPV